MAMYVALRAAGLEVHLRPALDSAGAFGYDQQEEYMSFNEWRRAMNEEDDFSERWDWRKWGAIESWIDRDGKELRDPRAKIWTDDRRNGPSDDRREVTVTDTDDEVALRLRELDRYRRFLESQRATFVGKKMWPFSTVNWQIDTLMEVFTHWDGREVRPQWGCMILMKTVNRMKLGRARFSRDVSCT